MNKKVIAFTAVPALALTLVGASTVSAHGWFAGGDKSPEEIAAHQTMMFEHQAALLGTSTDVVKDAWADGKRLPELAQELGMSPEDLQKRMQEEHKTMMEERMHALVDQGVITQEQAEKKMEKMLQKMEKHEGKMMFGRGHGKHGDRPMMPPQKES